MSRPKNWYNAERVAVKHSVVLAQWMATKSPSALKRQAEKRRFEAAQQSRLSYGWTTTNSKLDAELRGDLSALRARSRDLSINNDHARKFLSMVRANVVGPNGFTLQSQVTDTNGKSDSLARKAIEGAFWKWGRAGECETTGKMSFEDFCRVYITTIARDGEALARRIRDRKFRFGYRLQMLDIDRLDITYNENLKNGNVVRMSIEFDTYGAPVAYWLLNCHPGDYMQNTTALQRERIPADQIFHNFIIERPEQSRGFPWMASAMQRMQMLQGYEEAAIVAARNGASKMGFFVTPDGTAKGLGDGKEEGDFESGAGEFTTNAEAGTFDVIPEGYTFQQYNPEYPTANFDSFVKSCLRSIASGLDIAYNTMANDLEGVNFSSIRSGTLTERESWMVIQNWTEEALLRLVFMDWLESALLKCAIVMPNGSALPASKLEKFSAHIWQGRRWSWVDPMKDIEASVLAIKSGLSTPQIVAAQMGLDIEDVIDAIAQANSLALAAGLPSYSAPAASAPAKSEPTPDPDVQKMRVEIEELRQRQAAAPAQTIINNHMPAVTVKSGDTCVNLPEGLVKLEATIETPEVKMGDVIVDVAAPNIIVNPTPVSVENIMPSTMNVAIDSMPARETTTSIARDADDNIAASTQIEKDVR